LRNDRADREGNALGATLAAKKGAQMERNSHASPSIDIETVKRQAHAEYEHELFRAAVEKYKEKLRTKRSIWDRLFPWRVIIVRKADV
jgi:sugar (pentulose or hexulose) kinase